MDHVVVQTSSKRRLQPATLLVKTGHNADHAEDHVSQSLDLSSLISRFEEWHLTEPPTEPSAAGKFINIAELRLLLYNEMANSPTDAVRGYSGFFLASKTVYAEAEAEIITLRTKYIEGEEIKWTKFYGNNFFIGRPHCFRDMNYAIVTLCRELFRGINTGNMLADFDVNYHRFKVQRNSSSADYTFPQWYAPPQWILRDLPLDRLEFLVAPDDITAPIRIHRHCILSFRNEIHQALQASQPQSRLVYDSCTRTLTRKMGHSSTRPVRAQQMTFYWGFENVEGLDSLKEDDVVSFMNYCRGWEYAMTQGAGLNLGITATQKLEANSR